MEEARPVTLAHSAGIVSGPKRIIGYIYISRKIAAAVQLGRLAPLANNTQTDSACGTSILVTLGLTMHNFS